MNWINFIVREKKEKEKILREYRISIKKLNLQYRINFFYKTKNRNSNNNKGGNFIILFICNRTVSIKNI